MGEIHRPECSESSSSGNQGEQTRDLGQSEIYEIMIFKYPSIQKNIHSVAMGMDDSNGVEIKLTGEKEGCNFKTWLFSTSVLNFWL